MSKEKDAPLKIELFSDGEDSQFRIRSKREIQSILGGIAREGMRAALYYDNESDAVLTSLLAVNDRGVWLDAGPLAANNHYSQRVLRSKKLVVTSSHHKVKVQFTADHVDNAMLDGRATFHLPVPDTLLRIQRREYFRLTTPVSNPLMCVLPVETPPSLARAGDDAHKRKVTILDISGGGVALVCEVQDAELQPGNIYENCKISLPGVGTVNISLRVRNSFEITLRNGQLSRRAGCEFIHLGGAAEALLLRYVAQLQSEALVKT